MKIRALGYRRYADTWVEGRFYMEEASRGAIWFLGVVAYMLFYGERDRDKD
jgi:hypothetical protein